MRPAVKRPVWVTLALWQGVTAPVVFGLVAIIGGAMRPGYSHAMQAISELTEAGAAGKPYLDPPLIAMQLLTFAFGLGFWWVARRINRALQISAACLIFIGLLGLLYPRFPMDPMGAEMTFDGRMHLIIVSLSALCAILSVSAAAKGWFESRGAHKMAVFTLVCLLIMLASGIIAALAGSLGWLGIGIWQRVNTGMFSIWEIATALYLLHISVRPDRLDQSMRALKRGRLDRTECNSRSYSSVFHLGRGSL